MRNRTKKCIVLLLAILLLCLCVWRLTPRTFGQMTGADPQTISSLSGTAVLGGNRDVQPCHDRRADRCRPTKSRRISDIPSA